MLDFSECVIVIAAKVRLFEVLCVFHDSILDRGVGTRSVASVGSAALVNLVSVSMLVFT